MPGKITFEYWDFKKGIFYYVRVPYSERNLAAIRAMPNTRNIDAQPLAD